MTSVQECEVTKVKHKLKRLVELFEDRAPEKHPVFQAAKIAEETGEATNLVFKLAGFRRESHDSNEIRESLGEELADIVITTFVCARVCQVDLWKAIERKLDNEIERWDRFEPHP